MSCFSTFLLWLLCWFVFCCVFFYVSILLCNDFLFYMYYVEFGLFSSVFLLGFCWVSVYMFCGSTKFALPFGNPSNLPSQLASELGSLQLVSQVCRGKTSWTNTGQFQFRIRASKILRPPVPWCTSVLSSARLHRQKNCRAPPGPSQRDPVWKPLDSKETVSTKWANLEDRS